MRLDAEKRLLALGIGTDLIQKIEDRSLSLSSLRPMSKEALIKIGFTEMEVDLIISKVKRDPISPEVLERIILKSGEVCCYCADGNSTRPFHIHHMNEYHVSHDNSEDNLCLVCPNDHANVHSKKITLEYQKAIKRAWENVWSIAQDYKNKGIVFPFGAFEVVDYNVEGNITDIFSFASPCGSVCLELAKGILANHCFKTLIKENKLILAGGSGSGKTTLAKGIAGHFKNVIVFKYVVSDKTSVEIAKEITHFLTIAQKDLILIIDEANTKLKSAQIENVLQFANSEQKIILVNTRNSFNSEGNLEQHFPDCVEYISWQVLREDVASIIIEHETAVIEYLDNKAINDHNGHKIGYGTFDHHLNRVVEGYAKSTDTVWQFIFMLGGGLSRITKMYTELQATDRFDLVVLYTSIMQISKVEEGVSVDEIIDFYKRNSILSKVPIPEKDWLNGKLKELCVKRILVEVRGRYKTVHREFAKAFIETSYLINRVGCSELLDEVFLDFSRSKEIMILWSWLKYGQVSDYTIRWAHTLSIGQWKELTDETFKNGLNILQILARHLHSTSLPESSNIAYEVFKDKADAIAELINKGEDGTLYYFRELSTTLKYHCTEIIKPIMDAVDEKKFANLIKDSNVETFDYLSWLFNALSEGYIDWVIKFKRNFTFSDFERIIARNEKGRIRLVHDTIKFYRTYIGIIKRSEFKKCVVLIGLQIKRCDLDEIQFPLLHETALFELFYFPDDIKFILGSIDMPKITNSYEQATPRFWGSMLSFCYLSDYAKLTFAKDFVDGLDMWKVVKNIERHYDNNLHEFRIIMYQLAYASTNRRKEYAKRLLPLVENSMQRFPDKQDHEDVLKAFYQLDEKLGTEACKKLGKNLPDKKNSSELDFSESKTEIEVYEKSGKDYDLVDFLIQKKEDLK